MFNFIEEEIKKTSNVIGKIYQSTEIKKNISEIASEAVKAYKANNKILIAGNGGSAADAQHIAAELVSRFNFDRPALSAIALTVNTSILTAVGNDYGYERVFARQVEANGKKGDIFIGISTSGNSPNIIKAFEASKNNGLVTVGFTGDKAGDMEKFCDYCIKIPSSQTPKIQEGHIMIGHIICGLIEIEMFKEK